MPLPLSHVTRFRLAVIRWSSVPQAIQSRCNCSLAAEVNCGKALEVAAKSARAERANPREPVEVIESGEQRFRAAHGETGDGAGVSIGIDLVILFHLREHLVQ